MLKMNRHKKCNDCGFEKSVYEEDYDNKLCPVCNSDLEEHEAECDMCHKEIKNEEDLNHAEICKDCSKDETIGDVI